MHTCILADAAVAASRKKIATSEGNPLLLRTLLNGKALAPACVLQRLKPSYFEGACGTTEVVP
jgi:hypothetical protein